MAPRDPITQPASSSKQSTKNASAGRIKSISGGGPAFSSAKQSAGSPAPNSPYKGK